MTSTPGSPNFDWNQPPAIPYAQFSSGPWTRFHSWLQRHHMRVVWISVTLMACMIPPYYLTLTLLQASTISTLLVLIFQIIWATGELMLFGSAASTRSRRQFTICLACFVGIYTVTCSIFIWLALT